jgi:long-subunit fatty acid transport protein
MPLSFDYQAFEKLSFGLALQHDVTDYSAAPYYSEGGAARPALAHQQLVKNFAGLTLKGQLTESGKLNGNIRVGYSQYHYDSAAKDTDLSYSVNLSHTLTERLSHSLTLARDVTASSTNSQMASKNYTYGVAYNASEDLNFNLSATKSDVYASTSQVDTYAYTLGADYKYSKHLTFQASYSLNDSTASVASSTYTSNAFTLSAAFRY